MKTGSKKNCSGFTLMELLISIAIVAVLASVAIPSYLHYIKKSYYNEIIQTAERYKVAVTSCLEQNHGLATECNGGQHGIPQNIVVDNGVGQVSSVTVVNGVITVTPKASNGISTKDTYILTPSYSAKGVKWKASGGGCTKNLAPQC